MTTFDRMTRRDALKTVGGLAIGAVLPDVAPAQIKNDRPNIILIQCDQLRADVCRREGFPLDTMPCLDSLARDGAWFDRAYTASPSFLETRAPQLLDAWMRPFRWVSAPPIWRLGS